MRRSSPRTGLFPDLCPPARAALVPAVHPPDTTPAENKNLPLLNTAVVATVGRMASRSPDMMAALRRLKAETERLDVFLTSEWVASEENISDGLSRDPLHSVQDQKTLPDPVADPRNPSARPLSWRT